MLILVQTTVDPIRKRLNWESFPMTPKEGWISVNIEGDVNEFLLGKKFVNGELVAMSAEELAEQQAAISEENPARYISPRDFLKRFTSDEKTAIYTAAVTDVIVAQIKDDLVASEYIDLLNVDLLSGVSILVAKGLITEQRKNEIIAF